jgi:hypothetical protein
MSGSGRRARAAAALPLPYLAAALGAFLVAAAGLPVLTRWLVVTNDDPHVFALAHLVVLGWITMAMMGALHQLFPVALQARICSPRLGRWNLWLYVSALSGFIPSFFFAWTTGMAIFGCLTVLSILVFAGNLAASYRSVRLWHPMAFYVAAGLGWLVLTVGLGGLYVLDWHFGWFQITDAILAAHVQLGLAGWLSLTLMGVSYKLEAMFSLAHGHDERLALANLGLWNAGLVGLAASLWLAPQSPLVSVFAIWLGLSAAVFVVDMALLLRRRRRRLSLSQWHTFVSLGSFLAAAALGGMLAGGHLPHRSWVVAYGYIALFGWFGFSIVGKYCKIVPFLTWLRRFATVAGSAPTPLLREMVDQRVGWACFALLLAGYLGVAAGLLTASAPAVEGAGELFFVGALLFASAVVRLLWPRQSDPVRAGATAAGRDGPGLRPFPRLSPRRSSFERSPAADPRPGDRRAGMGATHPRLRPGDRCGPGEPGAHLRARGEGR